MAKIDATANDVPEKIQGFPTIKLYPAGDKDHPIDYQGSRSLEDLANFIKENGKHGVNGSLVQNEVVDEVMSDAEDTLIKAAPAATKSASSVAEGVAQSVMSAVSGAAEAVATFINDDDEGVVDSHDEL